MTNTGGGSGAADSAWQDWFAKVQIMGGPLMDWSMVLDPATVEGFFHRQMQSAMFRAADTIMGEVLIDFSYALPPGLVEAEGQGELRVAPAPGLSLDRITYCLRYDLLATILQAHPANTQIIVAFEEFRA
jgi:hypothetical protein